MEVKRWLSNKSIYTGHSLSCQLPSWSWQIWNLGCRTATGSVHVCDTLTVNMWCRILHSCSGEGKCVSYQQHCLFFHTHKTLKVKNKIATAFQQDDPIPFHSHFNMLWMLGSLITGLNEMNMTPPASACLTSPLYFTCGYISNTVNKQKKKWLTSPNRQITLL